MLILAVMGSTLLWQVIASALLVRIAEPAWLPNLGLLWLVILADRAPGTAAREGNFWISGLSLSVLIGYVLDLSFVAPRGLYMSVYGFAFVIVRLTTNKLVQGGFVRLFVTVGALSFSLDVTVWWIKGFITSFATVASFSPVRFAIAAAINGLAAAIFAPILAAPFDERTEGFR
jgi:hypothetical protein